MKSKILVLISFFTVLLLMGARLVKADEVSSHWIGEQDITFREYFESNVAVLGLLGGYTSADIMAEYDNIIESNPYAVCFYDSGQSSSTKTYVILFLPKGNYGFERASNGIYLYSSLDLTDYTLYGCSYNAKGQITFCSFNADMFAFRSVDTSDSSNFIYKYFASSVSRTSYFKSYSGCSVSADIKFSFYRPVFSNIDFQFVDTYDTYSYSYTACFKDFIESTDDIFYDVIYSNNTNNLFIGWNTNVAGYYYGAFDKISITVDMSVYNGNSVAKFSYTASRDTLSSTAGNSSTGILSNGNFYTGASFSQYVLCKSLTGSYDCITVDSVTVSFDYNNYSYPVILYHSGVVVLYGSLPNTDSGGITTDSEINSNLDNMWQNTDSVPDVHILTEQITGSYVKSYTLFTLDNFDSLYTYIDENIPDWCNVVFGSNSNLEDDYISNIFTVIDSFSSSSLGGLISVFDWLQGVTGVGDAYSSFVSFTDYYYIGAMNDVVIYVYKHSSNEYSCFVAFTERYFTREMLYNNVTALNSINVQLGEITKGLVNDYVISYNTYTYIKYRLDEMNDNSILFYNSVLNNFETSNVYLKSMTSTLSNVLIRLNSIDTSINTLDTNVSNYLLSQTNTLVNKIDELTSKTFNVSDDDTGVIEKLISIYDLISGLDVGGGDDTSLLDLIGKILDLLNGFSSDGIKLDNDLNVNVQLATGGVANEIDTPQELGFNWWDSEIDELTSKIVNGISGWYIDIIKIMNEQNTDNVFNNVSDMIQLFDEANDPIYEFFDPEFDIYRYE